MSLHIQDASRTAQVWSVSQLTTQIKQRVESGFPSVWVSGEISNLRKHENGFVYFALKDDRAKISSVIWRGVLPQIRFELRDGLEVVVHGHCSIFEGTSAYQIVIDQIEPKGLGALELAYRKLFERLQKEGLFAEDRKRPLPRFPRRIVLVTSLGGAAVCDMIQVISRRWRDVELWVRSVRVQGDGAAEEIAAAIAEVNRLRDVDVMIVGRGGGSLEDLWAFNEEIVARAIFASRIPVISAVGHEIDVTIADLVADVRASTPSVAGELVVPDETEVRERLKHNSVRLARALKDRLRVARMQVNQLASRRPFRAPLDGIRQCHQRCDDLDARLRLAARHRLRQSQQQIERLAAQLHGLSPLNVLARGYSLTTRGDGLTVVRDAAHVASGERLITRLARGRITSRVEQQPD